MAYIDALDALKVAGLTGLPAAPPAAAAAGAPGIDFDSLLAAVTNDEASRGTAGAVQDNLMSQIAERVGGAPNYLYAFHPSVYQKMADDPDFMQSMLNTVDNWTNSALFLEAKSSSDIFSSLLTGQDGSFAMASARVGDLAGSASILNFLVSDSSLLTQNGLESFLAQFEGLPEDLTQTLLDNFSAAQLATGGGDNAIYQAMAAAAEVQKRMLTE